MKRILAVYRDQTRASRAARELERRGFAPDRISILAADSASGQVFMASERSASKKSALAGAAVGTTGGLVAASLLGAGAIFSGPIAVALAGTVAGGLLGGLVGLGIPDNEAELRSRQIADGGILVAVDFEADDEQQRATAALGATDYLHIVEVDEPEIRKQEPTDER